jgi:hypothetical protein
MRKFKKRWNEAIQGQSNKAVASLALLVNWKIRVSEMHGVRRNTSTTMMVVRSYYHYQSDLGLWITTHNTRETIRMLVPPNHPPSRFLRHNKPIISYKPKSLVLSSLS